MNRNLATARLIMFTAAVLVLALSVDARAASEPRCRNYANSAIADYQQLRNLPKCSKLRPQDTVRWHPQYKLHFDWCLKAEAAWLIDESQKRDKLLMSCGGRATL